jgi:RimJ/RimL family protein N-acetyltransferase
MTTAWPLDDLMISGSELVLRPVHDDELAAFAAIFPDDFDLDPAYPPLDGVPAPTDRARRLVQSIWRHRGCWSIDDWALDFGVWRAGEPLGIQTLEGTRFTQQRTIDSASWIAKPFRGRGFGIQARELALAFAFEQLGADKAITSALVTNHASLGVSRHLGYRDNGTSPHDTGTETVQLQHLVLHRADWSAQPRKIAHINSFEPCRPFFALA